MKVEDVLRVARSFIGYHEKRTNAELDEFAANAGSGNWTRFARDLDAAAGFYNGPKNGYAWCDVFVDACFYYAAGRDAAAAMYALCQPERSAGAGCLYSANYYKAAGRWSVTPAVGAQVFFASGSDVYHTGLVEKVEPPYIMTIEGNTSDQVARRQYRTDSPNIYGYGLPRYDEAEDGRDADAAGDRAWSPLQEMPKALDVVAYHPGSGIHFRPDAAANDAWCDVSFDTPARVIAVKEGAARPVLVLMDEDLAGWVALGSLSAAGSVSTHHPSAAPTPSPQGEGQVRTYTVAAGDCLWDIAHKFGVSMWDIAVANGMESIKETIYPGDVLVIPDPWN